MKLTTITLLALLASHLLLAQSKKPVDFVNPFLGTGGEMGSGFGNMFPGAAYPFGMIQLSPDNGGQGWQYAGGYHYPDSLIVGFSHTHLNGTGVADYCDISLMPTTEPILEKYFTQEEPTVAEIIQEKGLSPNSFITRDGHRGPFDNHFLLKYCSKFSHAGEIASPGYYKVTLPSQQIDVELTTGELAAMHRYRFNHPTDWQSVVLNLGFVNTDRTTDAKVVYRSPQLITGYRFSVGKADQTLYFAIRFSRKIADYHFFRSDSTAGEKSAKGKNLAAAFSFHGKESRELLVQVAISSVSEEGALLNLQTADPFGWDFDQMKAATREKWNAELSKINIVTGDPLKKSIFYTSLYHCYIAPYRYSDADGSYKNYRQLPDKAVGFTPYTLLSLWDTFRAENPLLLLMQPKIEENIIHSMLAKFRQTGELPYWEISGHEGGSMIGYHAAVLMADALTKKVGHYDTEAVFRAVEQVSETNRKGLGYYRKYHFVPADLEKNGTVSKTLEYAYDDWCIAQIAKLLGKQEAYTKYMERASYYKNLYDPAYHLFRGKNSDGSWYEPFHPRFADYGNPHCVEGNTWQYSFFAPHDREGLIALMGGPAGFEMMLDSLFTQTSELLGEDTNDVTGLIGQYAHGNEPSHHVAYLYNWIGKPKKSQFYVNKILNTLYANTPEGLCGNEDCGQMSAWYVFSALGFYPVNPVDGSYYFGSPQFESVRLTLPNGKTFAINAKNLSAGNIYIKKTRLNGKELSRCYITYDEIQNGGVLEMEMTKEN